MRDRLFSEISILGVGQITTISNGPEEGPGLGANEVHARYWWQPSRHGTTEEAINNISNRFQAVPNPSSINLIGHGNLGILTTGVGQTGAWIYEKYMSSWNSNLWGPLFERIKNSNFPILSIYSCDTGAGEEGAEFLFRIAKRVQKAVRARTGLTIATYWSDGRYEISFEAGSDWQVATPDSKPNPIPRPPRLTYIYNMGNTFIKYINDDNKTKDLDPSLVNEITITFRNFLTQTTYKKTISQEQLRTISNEPPFSEPFEMKDSAVSGLITMVIEIDANEVKKKFYVYNDRLVMDSNSSYFYYLNPTFYNYVVTL